MKSMLKLCAVPATVLVAGFLALGSPVMASADVGESRLLVQSPSVPGEVASFKVAHVAAGDVCRWDAGSDGVVDFVGECGVFESAASSASVTVVDVSGVDHVLSAGLVSGGVDELDSDSWYQFKPFEASDSWQQYYGAYGDPCVQFYQPYDMPLFYDLSASLGFCSDFGDTPYAYDAVQVFKPSKVTTDQGVQTRMLWGYDDAFSWTNDNSYTWDGYDLGLMLNPTSSNDRQNVSAELSAYVDGEPFYSFRQGSECLTGLDWSLDFVACDFGNPAQLFAADEVSGEFGNWSWEKDVTAPTTVTGLEASWESGYAHLTWDPSTDNRTGNIYDMYYNVYVKNDATGVFEYVDTVNGARSYDVNASLLSGRSQTFKVTAMDVARNESVGDVVTMNRND
jgi:hypothetical protein